MRTTLRVDERLLHQIRQLAAEEQTTLTGLFEQALREMLARRKQLRETSRVPLPVSTGRGLQPAVDLNDTSALLELMEAGDDPA